MNSLKEILNIEDYLNAIKGNSMLVFSTTWCPDCHFLKTYIDDLVTDNPNWDFYYIDRDKMAVLCVELDILGIPSFIAYKDGKEVSRFVSKLRKTQEEVQEFIDAIE